MFVRICQLGWPLGRYSSFFGMLACCGTCHADIANFNSWSLVEDPAHPNFQSSVDSATQITLTASGGSIPGGTDIGFQSVNGTTPANSTQGYYFDPNADFSIAMDYSIGFTSPVGTLAFGMGVGEDQDGMNSAGVVLLTDDGAPQGFGAVGRINDVNQAPGLIAVAPSLTGRMLVSYDSASGDITLGVSNNGDDVAEGAHTYSAMQNSWGQRKHSGLFLSEERYNVGIAMEFWYCQCGCHKLPRDFRFGGCRA